MAYSMLQFFRHNLDEPSVSLHIWNGTDAMPYGYTTRNDSFSVSCAVMPKLEILTVGIFVRASEDGNGDFENIGPECLPSLRKLRVSIDSGRASAAEVDEAVVALKNTADGHPNHLGFGSARVETKRSQFSWTQRYDDYCHPANYFFLIICRFYCKLYADVISFLLVVFRDQGRYRSVKTARTMQCNSSPSNN
jgi:hypothetical protein